MGGRADSTPAVSALALIAAVVVELTAAGAVFAGTLAVGTVLGWGAGSGSEEGAGDSSLATEGWNEGVDTS